MRVCVGETLSTPRPVNGGAPQGSCAGEQMYTVGINDIDAGLDQPQPLRSPTEPTGHPRFLSSDKEFPAEAIPRPRTRVLSSVEDSLEDQQAISTALAAPRSTSGNLSTVSLDLAAETKGMKLNQNNTVLLCLGRLLISSSNISEY